MRVTVNFRNPPDATQIKRRGGVAVGICRILKGPDYIVRRAILQALGIQLPKLPDLSKEDIKAVRAFLPGKLLSRTAAFLALSVLALSFAGLVDQGLKRLLDVDLSPSPWVHFGLLFGLPLLAVATQLIVEWHAESGRRALRRLAVRPGVEQSGYFRIGPYLNSAGDRTKFDRADRAHEKVLAWIERSTAIPLYLTGDSGSGKSSLLNAFVLPALRDQGWTVVEARAWQDPETALRNALLQFRGARRSRQGENQELRQLLAAAARGSGTRLLLVLDQFEEFLILGQLEQQQKFVALLMDLQAAPIPALSLLLVLRSDYQILFDDLGFPPLRQGDNFYQVGRFTTAAATGFMARSGLNLHPDMLDRLLTSAAELDETPGLVRPITLNVIGYVLATGKAVALSTDAGQLVHRYIELTIGQPATRDFSPRVLEQLVTEQGTKRPRSEQELAVSTGLRRGEVRAVLNGLGDAALARPLDPVAGVWELSHDFIARAVTRFLGRRRRAFLQQGAFYAAPALLVAMLLVAAGVVAWDRLGPYEIRSELDELGLTVTRTPNGLSAERNSRLTSQSFLSIFSLLTQLPPLQSLDLSMTEVVDNLEPLKGLTALQSLNLNQTKVDNLEPLKGLTALRSLNLSSTQVDNLEPLKGLTALQSLDLRSTKVDNLEPLKGFTALQSLDLRSTKVDNLEPLKDLTALRSLDLSSTKVDNLEPLKGLTALQSLYLSVTKVDNLEPLKGLTALQSLYLRSTKVDNLEPLKGLTALQSLDLSVTQVDNLEPLKGLTALQSLYLSETKVDNLEPLKGLTALRIYP
jgi:Leucine-rich repeat (LRR) protein